MEVRDVMTIKEAIEFMRREQVLRISVVNPDGAIQGILAIKDVVPDSAKGCGENRESVQSFYAPGGQMQGTYTPPVPSKETPPAFDPKGYSPLERVINERKED